MILQESTIFDCFEGFLERNKMMCIRIIQIRPFEVLVPQGI